MSSPPHTLAIHLADQLVGWLVQRGGRIGIRFNEAWRVHPRRRVFSLSVEETGLADVRATPNLPTWFENLQFEGAMRRWIEASESRLARGDMAFLERIGSDLPGAVTLHRVDTDISATPSANVDEPARSAPSGGLRWSLAGVQLKLNLCERGDRYTLPVHGELGHFIAKLEDRAYVGVPLNEHATLTWAAACGINTVESTLLDVGAIDELPPGLVARGEPALLVRRYDRAHGQRIHAEEFAQALGVRPTDKYGRLGWRHHLKLVGTVAPEDVAEYLRRLLFVIASGNGDAHHKNWSFLYPDGRTPRLAPAYDLVATVQWAKDDAGLKDELAFRLEGDGRRSRRWEDASAAAVLQLLVQAGVDSFQDGKTTIDARDAGAWIAGAVERIRDTLPVATKVAGPTYAAMIEAHWRRTPLLRTG